MSKFALEHEPTTFSELVFADTEVEKRLGQYASSLRTKSIILHGAYGTGKSTIAKLLVAARDPVNTAFWPTINCGAEPIDFRQRLGGRWGFSEWLEVEQPMCVLEEADLLSKRNQFEIRAFMDLYGGMFVLTTNHLHSIDKSLQSRCDVIEILPPTLSRYLPAARHILQQNAVPMDDIRLARLLQSSENWRQTLEALEDVVREYHVLHPQRLPAA